MSLLIPRLLVYSPSGEVHPGPVVASGRAGALGVLDLAIGFDWPLALQVAEQVARYGPRPFGLRLPAEALGEAEPGELARILPEGLRVLICTEPADGDWRRALGRIHALGRLAAAEATSRASAAAAAQAGAQAIVLAGLEAGGRCGDESSFVLLQGALAAGGPPVWVRGGIGPRVAAACVAAGAAGVVLDGAALLARESPLPAAVRERLVHWDGSETVVLGRALGRPVRVHGGPASPVLARLREAESQGLDAWERALSRDVGWRPEQAWPAGQDAAFAARLACKYVSVGGVVQAFESAIESAAGQASVSRKLAEGSPLAQAHHTRYPIVQGPMTRVSDTVAFAHAVAEAGGLPFLALALMRGDDVRGLLAEAKDRLAGRSWGVGILGFVPPELRLEQVAAIREASPPFALIAGGRPDQAQELDAQGIATYLHVPSPGLLSQYLHKENARRFVLEGRECGGHVGPRSSFVLWEQAVEVVADAIERGVAPEEVHLLFAGGIHDARSAAIVAAIAAPLAERGVRVGVLLGTAYLFTAEAVATGAIVPGFQDQALQCTRTVLLETGPGHEVRVSPTPFAEAFLSERQRLLAEGRALDDVRQTLEDLNVGRLRVAAKGVDRSNGRASSLVSIEQDDQRQRGLYMVGQVAALRDGITTIAALHEDICAGSQRLLDATSIAPVSHREQERRPADVAIVGMAAVFPGARDVRTFWENTLRGFDAITEVPIDRWDWRLYYDPDPKAPDKITSKWGGFLPEIPFDPLRYGMPPTSLTSIEPMHLLTLEVVRSALDDAGYRERPFPRERTAVVLGAGGGAAQLAMGYAFRSYLPLLDTVNAGAGQEALAHCASALPEWTEDSFPGILLNVAAGRVANRFDLGGANYTVDAACGSSLAAAALAVRELETGAADMVILGGADTVQNPFTYLAFSKTHAFSPGGRCRPFDAGADGIVISEGVAALVLKRLADAERDGDRIYAVIKGMGASSDGRAKGLTAPNVEGQVRALERAYERAGISPASVGYVEAHGTGTAAGDLAEVSALTDVYGKAGAAQGECALGSVKSSIGHTKCAAGLAGLVNASLALYHKTLPPTIGVKELNPRAGLPTSPFHVNTQTRPWLRAADSKNGRPAPRRAGVSAFGFGGTNFHAVLEAYEGDTTEATPAVREWPAELLVWRAKDRAHLLVDLERVQAALALPSPPALRELAATLAAAAEREKSAGGENLLLAIVTTSLDDLRQKVARAHQAIAAGQNRLDDPRGIHLSQPANANGEAPRVAFLFPGQGSQYPGMLSDLAVSFPEVREAFEQCDSALAARGERAIGALVFPPQAFSDAEREAQRQALCAPDVAQPAVGAGCVGLVRLLASLGLEPDLLAGHSYGELVALHVAGSFSAEDLAALSLERGRILMAAAGDNPGAMAAIAAGPAQVNAVLDGIPGAHAVNWNGPSQTVISGTSEAVAQAVARAGQLGLRAQMLPVACAFHSPLVAKARAPLESFVAGLNPEPPRKPVFANATASAYPAGGSTIARALGEHLTQPVRFAEMVEALYDAGARVFVEVGPGGIVAALTESILAGRPHVAVSCDRAGRPGLVTLLHALAKLFAAGVPLRLSRLTHGRAGRKLDSRSYAPEPAGEPLSASTWMVNGARVRPLTGPEPPSFGRGPALTDAQANSPKAVPQAFPSANGNGHLAVNQSPHDTTQLSALLALPADGDRVLEAFQQTMRKFLDIQQETMLRYLASRGTQTGRSAQRAGQRENRPDPSPPTKNGTSAGAPIARAVGQAMGHNGATGNGKPARPAPAQPAPTPAVHHDRPDGDALAQRLLQIVQERTGYPAEMLRLDLDLEADLGIDSIKRVEILGSLRESLPSLGTANDSDLMDRLSRARTLGAIVEKLASAVAPAPSRPPLEAAPAIVSARAENSAHAPAHSVASANGTNGHAHTTVSRMLLEAVDARLPSAKAGLAPGGIVLVTDDGRGIARAIAADLRGLGHPVVRVRHGTPNGEGEGVNLTSAASVSALLDRIRAQGPLAAIVHALPLRDAAPAGLDPSAWSARMGAEVRGLYLLARAAADDLARSADRGGACLIAASALGGAFASTGEPPAECFPGQGGVAGLVKTLAREWPSVRCRAVDLDPRGNVEVLGAHLVHEVLTADSRAEVGYWHSRRVALRTVVAPLVESAEPGVALAPGEPLLVTGGARGITAAVVADLARRWQPTLLLLGTSPQPPSTEQAHTAGVTSAAELKRILHARLGQAGEPAGPADVERAYRALCREREIRANLERFRAAGARVEYARADVRNSSALREALAVWTAKYGPPRGLIHGAGVIHDKLLCDKTPESFDRVLGTKLDGALALAGLVEPERLRFAAFFSSVAGRFGNRGQGDYAAANEALNKLALWLDRRWACRVVSVLWGPWSGVGMVSDLEAHLARRGLGMIAPEVGASRLADELRLGKKGEVEVIVAADIAALAEPPRKASLGEDRTRITQTLDC